MPGIEDNNAGAFEVSGVSCHNGHVVNQSRRRNQRVGLIAPVGNVQVGTTCRNRVVNWQNTARELRTHVTVEPGTQPSALCGVSAVYPKYTPLQFENCDRRKEKARCIFRSDPCDDIGIGFAVTPNGTSACTRVSMAISGTAAFHPIHHAMPGTRSTITFQIGHQPSSVPPVSDLLRL